MKHIIVLEPNIANKIAAGEVVERPASIVKELIENSIDAGSTAITIEIRNGGIDYIRVTDNGSGIDQEDAETAFLRHATSKISTAEELNSIETFGFRGEALASIAAVSRVSMRTRTKNDDAGTHIAIDGGSLICCEPSGCPEGTTIEVQELFYNVPARLKFLKSPRSEAAMIGDYVLRLILANSDVSIKFINNGKTIYHSAGNGKLEDALICVYGSGISDKLYKIGFDDGYLRVTGYVGSEVIARNSKVQQSVFVNNRYIKSPIVSYAVQRAFDARLMNGRFPFFVLNILISSREIDVNVHPNKLSVRFKDDERIGFAITRAIKDSLSGITDDITAMQNKAVMPSAMNEHDEKDKSVSQSELYQIFGKRDYDNTPQTENEALGFMSNASKLKLSDSGSASMPGFVYGASGNGAVVQAGALYEPSDAVHIPLNMGDASDSDDESHGQRIKTFRVEENAPDTIEITRPEQIDLGIAPYSIIGVAFDSYIIVQQGDAIYYIDQHAAHERMLYERLISNELRFDSQILMVPDTMRLEPLSFVCLLDNIERFEELGFSIDVFGENTICVRAVPNILRENSESFINFALSLIAKNGGVSEIDLIRSQLIQTACKRAVKAGDKLEEREIERILSAYAEESVPLTCPHGRPVIIRVKKSELQRMFKRIL